MSGPYLQQHCRIATRDLDEAREAVGRLWEHHHSYLRAGRSYELRWHQANLPKLSLSYVESPVRLNVVCGPLISSYHFSMLEAGAIRHRISGRQAVATPRRAVLHVPGQVLTLETEPFRLLLLNLNRELVDEALTRRFGYLPPPEAWSTDLSLASPQGACLQSLCRWAAEELDRPGSWLLRSPPAAANLERTILTVFLDSIGNLNPSPRRGDYLAAGRLRAIEAWMEVNFAEPIGVEEMASVAGVSVRTVQAAFQRLRGCTPSEALTRLRLEEAHRRLLRAGPAARVTGVAADCGFFHFGRFAAQYRRIFGETPSATLRRATGPRESRRRSGAAPIANRIPETKPSPAAHFG